MLVLPALLLYNIFLKTHLLVACKFEDIIFMSRWFKDQSQENIIAEMEYPLQ